MEDEEDPQCGKPDFVLLDQVTMEDFMENLKLRWAQGPGPSPWSPGGQGLHILPLTTVSERRALGQTGLSPQGQGGWSVLERTPGPPSPTQWMPSGTQTGQRPVTLVGPC